MPARREFLYCIVLLISFCSSGFGQTRLLIPYKVDSLWGFCDTAERIVIPPQFGSVDPFIHGVAIFSTYTKDIGKDEQMVGHGKDIHESMESMEKHFKYGLTDTTGQILLPAEYDHMYTTGVGRTYMTKNKVKSVRYPSGVLFTPHRYTIEHAFNDEWFVVRDRRHRFGVIDTNERVMIPFRFNYIDYLDEKGYAQAATKNGRTGFIDRNGKFIFSFKKGRLGVASSFEEDLAMICVGKEKGYVDNYHYGFIDRQGKIVLPAKYRRVDGGFSSGLCAVNNGERSGYINRRGDTILPFKYGGTSRFTNGYGSFGSFNESGLIDTTGKLLLRVSGEASFRIVNRDFIIVERYSGNFGHVSGLMDLMGREILPFKYRLIGMPENGLFCVIEEGGKLYYMDMRLHAYRGR